MTRPLHRFTGLILGLFLTVVALSGAALSVLPALESWGAGGLDMTAAELVSRVTAANPGVEEILVSAAGRVTAYTADATLVVDPVTGAGSPVPAPGAWVTWAENLHRSLFLGDAGRIAVAVLAAAMLGLSATGLRLLARRAGGWRAVLAPQKGRGWARTHAEVARAAALALVLSSLTGLWMTASTFDLLPAAESPDFPAQVSGLTGAALPLDFPASQLRDLTFPRDAQDAFALTTTEGSGYIDQGTGATLAWVAPTWADRVSAWAQLLHTGQGAAVLGLVLGLAALTTPFLAVSGALMRSLGRRQSFASAQAADTVILVGSEGGSTWGFAQTLARALRAKGGQPHLAPLSDFAPETWPQAKRLLVLTATYGDGEAPASAGDVLSRIKTLPKAPAIPLAVLGFGDRSFPRFCAFAEELAAAAHAKGWPRLMPLASVDRQSAQDFARWGRDLGAALGMELSLDHEAPLPATDRLALISRRDYGADLQMPAAILRFAAPKRGLWARLTGQGAFQPGDLLGILPEGSTVPRFYSLASGSRDGFVEICIRRHEGGLCSGQLHAMKPGDQVRAFVRPNPAFHAGDRPLILIGAGTGIGPLAGIIRGARQPARLFFGMRHAASDYYYAEDLAEWQAQGRLTGLHLAFSRGNRPHYVQDALRLEAEALREAVARGARIMVCGGREMGAGVRATLSDILSPLTLDRLAKEGRYAEDTY
ncbi:PepSY domain-containing protein [Stagnihabitans tardus]|uniref:NADPH--hemoprotein reductase n=1 Tax=Stagnihabitans tardus TaxID=2699202 RepID=A0AAE4Y8N8_9RHOB|nr:PepSY domain-containing protein [Stagnihabitans tardus]NBZ86996.1 N-acetylglucosamine transferase [Stagnihabitans tardus]